MCAGQTLLRARGGISSTARSIPRTPSSSPRTRRYFRDQSGLGERATLFSAHAEVFPASRPTNTRPAPLLRARGGISKVAKAWVRWLSSSPRTRRYFPLHPRGCSWAALFSAHAEVFPLPPIMPISHESLLRARGGISGSVRSGKTYTCSSPRTRRYFHHPPRHRRIHHLFSAHAEVFPKLGWRVFFKKALLRARGGISLF